MKTSTKTTMPSKYNGNSFLEKREVEGVEEGANTAYHNCQYN